MRFSVCGAILSAGLAAFTMCLPASARDANEARATVGQLSALVERAEAGGDGLRLTRTVPVSMTLLTVEGVPVAAYRRDSNWKYGDYIDFTFDCPAPGVLRMTFMVEPYGGGLEPDFTEPGVVSDVQIRSKDLDLDVVLQDGALMLGPVATVKEEDGPSSMFRIAVEVPSNGPVANALGRTGNLQVILKEGSQYLRLSGGANLEGFETDLRPLVERCARTDPNYRPPPPTVAEVAAAQPIGRHPTQEQLQVALTYYYGLQVAIYTFLFNEGDTSFEYENFKLHECVTDTEGLVYCSFSGRMLFGGETLAPIVELINGLMAITGPRWVSLTAGRSGWRVEQDYRSCRLRATSIYCDWHE